MPSPARDMAFNLDDIGAVSLDDYLDGHCPPPPPSAPSLSARDDGNAVTRLHQACQRLFHSTAPLKFEFIQHTASRLKQCILTVTKPDGVQRSYATQPVFAKKNDAKSEAAKIAIDMGALEFLSAANGDLMLACDLARTSPVTSAADDVTLSVPSLVDNIELCCVEWRAGCVAPRWVPFFDLKSPHKQGCALCIPLSPHLARVYLSEPTFDSHSDAKLACAKVAVLEGVLDFIKYGNGQTRPASPNPSTSSTPPTTPWTLQAFYDSLPKPFPESFATDDASDINAPASLNSMVQNARGGMLSLSFYSTSDGPPGLHGCLLKLDHLGEYKAYLVDARFPKRSDAKAAVCLQAMSEGIGDYIRSIASAIESRVTPLMRSFSNNLVYPALTSELSKVDTHLRPYFEYDKERDAYGATLVVRLPTLSAPDQVRRYTVPSECRNKADAKVAVICHAAEQGVVEFVRFRGGTPPGDYTSPYVLHTYNPEASRKRKQPGCADDTEQGWPAKKKKGKRRADSMSVHPSSDQVHGISRSGDMGLPQSVPTERSCDPSQPGVGGGSGSGAARPGVHGYRASYNAQMYALSYPPMLDTTFASVLGSRGYHPFEVGPPPESGPSRARSGMSVKDAELEPGEVVSSAESEFSVSSSRNEEQDEPANERTPIASAKLVADVGGENKGKGKETWPASPVTREDPGMAGTSHVKQLIEYCAAWHCGAPSFHETQRHGRYHVWIVIGKERYDLPTTYGSAEEGQQRVAKQVLARLIKGSSE